MTNNNVYIDVWDADSLLHLGVCTVPLKSVLRQGKAGVTIEEDLDIIWTEFPDDSPQPAMPRSSSISSQLSTASGSLNARKTKVMNVGKLHLRLTNIARSAGRDSRITYAKDVNKLSLKDSVVIHDYHESIRHRLEHVSLPKRVYFSSCSIYLKSNSNLLIWLTDLS